MSTSQPLHLCMWLREHQEREGRKIMRVIISRVLLWNCLSEKQLHRQNQNSGNISGFLMWRRLCCVSLDWGVPLYLTGLGSSTVSHWAGGSSTVCHWIGGFHCVSLTEGALLRLTGLGGAPLCLTDWEEFHCVSLTGGSSTVSLITGEFHCVSLDWGVPLCVTDWGGSAASHWSGGSSTVSHWLGGSSTVSHWLGGVALHLTGLRTTGDWCLLGELASHRDGPFVSPTLTSPKWHTSYIVTLLAVALSAINHCHDVVLISSARANIKGNSLQGFSVGGSSSKINPRNSVK